MTIRMEISQISTLSRNTQGVRLISLKDNQKVSATAIIEKEEIDESEMNTEESVIEQNEE